MTENEAIKELKYIKRRCDDEGRYKDCDALEKAIKALEEIQQYRAIETELRERYHANVDIKMIMQHFIETIFKGEKHEGFCILTNEDAKMWDAYRAIGTVEGYERAIESSIENYNLYREYKVKVEKFEAIGTIEEFKALKEKSVPKKPTPIDYKNYMDVVKNAKFLRGAYWCPNCKHTVRSGSYCDDCGQKLDWSE